MLSFSNDVIWASLSATGKSAAALTAKTAANTITNFMLIFGCSTLSLLNERAQLNDVDSEIAGVFYTDSMVFDGCELCENECYETCWNTPAPVVGDSNRGLNVGKGIFANTHTHIAHSTRSITMDYVIVCMDDIGRSTQSKRKRERERNIHSLGTPATRTHIHTAISGNYGQFNRRPIAVSLTNNHFHAAMSTWYAQHICSLMKLTANHLWPKTNSMRCFCLRFVVCMCFWHLFRTHHTSSYMYHSISTALSNAK